MQAPNHTLQRTGTGARCAPVCRPLSSCSLGAWMVSGRPSPPPTQMAGCTLVATAIASTAFGLLFLFSGPLSVYYAWPTTSHHLLLILYGCFALALGFGLLYVPYACIRELRAMRSRWIKPSWFKNL